MTKREKAIRNILQKSDHKLKSKSFVEMQESMDHFKKMVDSGVVKRRGYNILSVGEPSKTFTFNIGN